MKLTEKAQSKTHRVLVFGSSKSGKSKLVGQLAEHFKLLWLDIENGHKVLYQLPVPFQENIELVEIPDTKVFPIGIQTMLKVITGVKQVICHKHGNISCSLCKANGDPSTEVELNALDDSWIVVVDSITQLANSAMNHITKNEEELFKPGWPEFMKQGFLMDKFLSQAQQARFNIICITHEAEVEMEDGSKRLVPVSGTTNFSRNTAKYFDDVVYCRVANKKHNFSSSSTANNNVLTGSRSGVAIEDEEFPTLLRIFKPEVLPPLPVKPAIVAGMPVPKSSGTPGNISLENLKKKLAGGA